MVLYKMERPGDLKKTTHNVVGAYRLSYNIIGRYIYRSISIYISTPLLVLRLVLGTNFSLAVLEYRNGYGRLCNQMESVYLEL